MRVGVYIQVPFCQTKCTYCNFHTGVVSSGRFAPYVDAVRAEIGGYRRLYAAGSIALPQAFDEAIVDTVYIGGGTPSLLEARDLQRLLDTIRDTFSMYSENEDTSRKKSGVEAPHSKSRGGRYSSESLEVTLEADPETIEAEKAAAWVRAGINRVSFGVQSFSDKELAAAGRMHRRADTYGAAPILREAGIGNIGFDLIAGLPHQTKESWLLSLDDLSDVGRVVF